MNILALDCATKTGWAAYCDGAITESGVQDFAKRRGESNGLMFLKFRKWLKEIVWLWKPDLIAYERAHYRGGAATNVCVGLTTRVEEVAALAESELAAVTTTELKKFATGGGKASKEDMVAAAQGHIGRPPIDDNEADAIMIAMWAANEYE